jgi:aryl-alcohol dehydrogenase-like predicted oxidoreductase
MHLPERGPSPALASCEPFAAPIRTALPNHPNPFPERTTIGYLLRTPQVVFVLVPAPASRPLTTGESTLRYKLLGRSGLRVSELCLGTMTFGEDWGWGSSMQESRRVFDAYANAGGNFIDTAINYTNGTSEKYLGEMLSSDRDHFVVATKFTLSTRPDDPNSSGNHRKNMMRSVEESLKRLRTDRIDLYWLHAWDFTTGIDEVMRAFDDLVSQGKILYAGLSDTPAWIVSAANTAADLRGWAPIVAVQIEYSLIERTVERDLVPMARAFDLGVTAWSPLGSGVLTGKYKSAADAGRPGQRIAAGSRRISEINLAIAREVEAVARELGRTPSQIAIGWVRQKAGVVIPIVGARTAQQLEDNLGCLEFTIPDDAMARLDAVSAIPLGFPHDFLGFDHIRELVYGKKWAEIDRHR